MAAGHRSVCDVLPRQQCTDFCFPSVHAAASGAVFVPGEFDPDAIARALAVQPEPNDEWTQPVTVGVAPTGSHAL
eukprot:10506975-Lingulodinium_polyedra.AAC.1